MSRRYPTIYGHDFPGSIKVDFRAMAPHADAPEEYRTVGELLRVAQNLVAALSADPWPRLMNVFAKFPCEDWDSIIGILDREAQSRLIADATAETLTGLSLRLNPNARLYVRTVENEPAPDRRRAVMAAVRAVQLTHQGPLQGDWEAEALQALRELTPAERASVAAFNRKMLGLVERAEPETQ